MIPNLLILGGTTEATALARAVAEAGIAGIVSFAGRVARPVRQPLPQRVGGFGGVSGLAAYLQDQDITHVVDATHPFAAQMSRNAIAACAQTGVPLVALTRAPWLPRPGDAWTHVADIAGAVAALDHPRKRVMLAVGRMHLAEFAPNPQHVYLLRLVDAPGFELPLPHTEVLVSRGPFTQAEDEALMQAHSIDVVVSKNAGGTGAYAKIAAARALGLPVIMIGRPFIPVRQEVTTPAQVLNWVSHCATDRGV
ncbi:cobalt-precorrin-6A reductase [Rhodophyticola sp. CCM32]|uniref:cobalt-precorrin-6A reductase n=1 Tax=Rhodophyticola sp. CCM32 TaxID=2916397 RepID=UPI00107F4FB9|nr:cobalt-precorrin-6A reductase [Rhodophyticola sp. CCM32]QBY01677.1 cobalt-precorrin-6A reductase [Rhodophyticola sp. CCM32]